MVCYFGLKHVCLSPVQSGCVISVRWDRELFNLITKPLFSAEPLQAEMTRGRAVGRGGNSLHRSPAISVGVHYTHRPATHTHMQHTHTQTHSYAHMQYLLWEIITLTTWTLVGRCVEPSPHHTLTIRNMFVWTSPAPPRQTESPTASTHTVCVCVCDSGSLVFRWQPLL